MALPASTDCHFGEIFGTLSVLVAQSTASVWIKLRLFKHIQTHRRRTTNSTVTQFDTTGLPAILHALQPKKARNQRCRSFSHKAHIFTRVVQNIGYAPHSSNSYNLIPLQSLVSLQMSNSTRVCSFDRYAYYNLNCKFVFSVVN